MTLMSHAQAEPAASPGDDPDGFDKASSQASPFESCLATGPCGTNLFQEPHQTLHVMTAPRRTTEPHAQTLECYPTRNLGP